MTVNLKKSEVLLRGAPIASLALITVAFLVVGRRGNCAPRQDGAGELRGRSSEAAQRKSAGCATCHSPMDEATMHPTKTVQLGCTDCHGGDPSASIAAGAQTNSPEYFAAKEKAHVKPRDPVFRNRAALPQDVFAKWLAESADYVKFVNPGDLRVAAETCGTAGCHAGETRAV